MEHGTAMRALFPDEKPLRPRYVNWADYLADPCRTIPIIEAAYVPSPRRA
jgi:hypothetical protein